MTSALSNKIQQIAEKEYPKGQGWATRRAEFINQLTEILKDRELLQEAMKELDGKRKVMCGEDCGCQDGDCRLENGKQRIIDEYLNNIYP